MFTNEKGKVLTSYLGKLISVVSFLGPNLMLGKIESQRRSEQQRMRWLDGITESMDMSLSTTVEIVKDREAWHASGPKQSDTTS